MTVRRSVVSGILAAAVILPAILWLSPALFHRQAPSFRDQGDFFYPIKLHTVDRIRAGELPLWNPLSGEGEPWLANGQSGVFYPPTFFFLLPWPGVAASLFLLFHFAVAALGFRRFVKDEGISEPGALFGGAIYCAGGFAASLSGYWNHFGGWAYLPGICALARSGLETRRQRLGFGLLIGLSAMAGSPEMTAASLLAALVFVLLARHKALEGWAEERLALSASRVLVSAVLGLALAGWALVPMAELASRSDRRVALPAAQRETGVVNREALASALGTGGDSSGTSYLSSLYVGPVAVLAAFAAFGETRQRSLVWLLAAFALAGILVAARGWPGPWIRAVPPLDRLRYPAKAMALPHFSISVLAAIGLDRQRFVPGTMRRRLVFCSLALAAVVLSVTCARDAVVRSAGVGAGAALFLLSCGWVRSPRATGVVAAAAAISLAMSLAFAGKPLFLYVPDAEIRREPEAVASFSHVAGRVVTPPMGELAQRCFTVGSLDADARALRCQRESLLGYTNLLFGVRTVRTAAALPTLASKRIEDSMDAAPDPIVAAGAVSARLLWTPFQPARLPSLKVGEFFRAPIAPYRPRLSFVHGYRVDADAERAWNAASSGKTNLAREVTLDRPLSAGLANETSQPLLVARMAEDLPERVVAEVTASTSGLLVLTDLWYPGWIAEVDGKREELRRADGYFRAVPLPAGTHRVVFRYRPLSVLIGAALSAAALLILVLTSLARPPNRGALW